MRVPESDLSKAWEAILNLAEGAYAGTQTNQEVSEGLRVQACVIEQIYQDCSPSNRKGLQRLLLLLNDPIEVNQAWRPVDWAEWLADIPSLAELDGRSRNGE